MIDYSKIKKGDKVKVVGQGAPGFAELGDVLTITDTGTNKVWAKTDAGDVAFFALAGGAERLELVSKPIGLAELKRSRMAWPSFIETSMTRPGPGHWSDMCRAPVDRVVWVYCEPGILRLAACVEMFLIKYDRTEWTWSEVTQDEEGAVKIGNPINPSWWQPIPALPPLRPTKQ